MEKKRYLSLAASAAVAAACLGSSMTGSTVSAESYGDHLTYQTVDEDGDGTSDYVEIISCDDTAEEIVIPGEIESLPVKSIGENAFEGCSSLISVEIPEGVTSIGSSAFWNCTALEYIEIPGTVEVISDSAFWDCTALQGVTIGSGVKSIDSYAFYDCLALKTVDIPRSVKSIGDSAFSNCESLTDITINNPKCDIYDDSLTICNGESGSNAGFFDGTIYGGEGSTAQTYAETYEYNFAVIGTGPDEPAETSGSCGDSLTWELLEGGVLKISGTGGMYDYDYDTESEYNSPFSGRTDIKSVVVEDGAESIGQNAFCGCTALTKAELAESVAAIGDKAFYGCEALETIRIENPDCDIFDDSVTICNGEDENWQGYFSGTIRCYIGSTAQDYAETYGYSYELIDAGTRNDTSGSCGENLTWELSGDGVLIISGKGDMYDYSAADAADAPFSGRTEIVSLIVEEGVTSIGKYAFADCTAIADAELPASLKTIGADAFNGCSALDEIRISSGVTAVADRAFAGCGALSKVTIAKSLSELSKSAFEDCTALSSFVVSTENESFSSKDGVLFNKDKSVLVMYPMGKSEGIYAVPGTVTEIGESAFAGNAALLNVTVPKSVTTISEKAFYSCAVLDTIIIENPECEIFNSPLTICNIDLGGNAAFAGTIFGSDNSSAQAYAAEYNRDFSSTSTEPEVTTTVTTTTGKTTTTTTSKTTVSTSSSATTAKATTSAASKTTAVTTTTPTVTTVTTTDPAALDGDANGDGKVNVRDAAFIASMLAQGKENELPKNSDFNGDGKINVRDAAAIAKFLATGKK